MTDTNINDPFAQTNTEEIANPYEHLVGEGKKFKSPEDLARGKLASDRHIATLETELATLRQQAAQGMSLEQFYERIKSTPPANNEPPVVPPENNGSVPSPDDIRKIVNDSVLEAERNRVAAQNKDAIVAKLNDVWGTNSTTELAKASSTLGISVSRLQEIGVESPQALFTLLKIDQPNRVPGGSTVPTSTVNLHGGSSGKRDQKYYQELRRTNPKLYQSSKVQAQEHRDALELGEAFFNN